MKLQYLYIPQNLFKIEQNTDHFPLILLAQSHHREEQSKSIVSSISKTQTLTMALGISKNKASNIKVPKKGCRH